MKHFSLLSLVTGILAAEIAFAQLPEINLFIQRQTGETYEQMVQRAEKIAQTAIENRFKQNKSLEALKIVISAENQGAIAPLLAIEVTRQEWQKKPQARQWATQFPFSKTLLGFESSTPKPPSTNNTDTATPPPSPQHKPSPSPAIIPDALPLGDPDAPEEPQQSLPNQRLRVPPPNTQEQTQP